MKFIPMRIDAGANLYKSSSETKAGANLDFDLFAYQGEFGLIFDNFLGIKGFNPSFNISFSGQIFEVEYTGKLVPENNKWVSKVIPVLFSIKFSL